MALGKRESVRIHYSGNVQGVGFRYTVKSVAMGYEVTGQVRNLADGRVELVVEGDREELTAFLEAIRDSGLGPCIRHEDASWSAAVASYKGFEIVR